MLLSDGCSLLRAEGFFCNLDVLYGGLGIGKIVVWSKKKVNVWIGIKCIRIRNPAPTETKKLECIHEKYCVERKNEGRKPDKNSSLRRLEFKPRKQCCGSGSGVGSKTFCQIRIRSQIRDEPFRIRIRAALIRNEFETISTKCTFK